MQHEHTKLAHPHWGQPIEDIDAELVQLAMVCGARLLEPGVVARMLHNDSLVCDHDNPRAFEKMRQLLMMHYVVTERAVEALGPDEALSMEATILARLRERFGESLGELLGPGQALSGALAAARADVAHHGSAGLAPKAATETA